MKLKITFYCYLWKTLFPLFVRLFNYFDVQNAHALFSHLQKVKAQSKCSSLRSDYFKTCFVMNITFMFVFVIFDVKPIITWNPISLDFWPNSLKTWPALWRETLSKSLASVSRAALSFTEPFTRMFTTSSKRR